jgi:hypothetical protein
LEDPPWHPWEMANPSPAQVPTSYAGLMAAATTVMMMMTGPAGGAPPALSLVQWSYEPRAMPAKPKPAALSTVVAKNSAFVFLKPHAATPAAKSLLEAGLKAHGMSVVQQGTLDGATIDDKMYIDAHYYSIASKATILEPKDLNVPADKFSAKFGVGWEEALAQGKVFNAKQAKARLGCTDEELGALWSQAEKVKLGGGFYCGLLEVKTRTTCIIHVNGIDDLACSMACSVDPVVYNCCAHTATNRRCSCGS